MSKNHMFKLLDLFCGAGGAAVGYANAGFYVVGIDKEPQPHYPFEFHVADALSFASAHGHEFDVIHASPPCQKYTGLNRINHARGIVKNHPDLIDTTRQTLQEIGKPYVIENVHGSPIKTQVILCGKSLGLTKLARHRHFESNILFFDVPRCTHRRTPTIGVYGSKPDGRRVTQKKYYQGNRLASSTDEASNAMEIDWMNWNELTQAIPPAYTEFLGRQLIDHLKFHHAL